MPRRSPRAVAGNDGAKAAVDVALHDLAARRLRRSLPVGCSAAPRCGCRPTSRWPPATPSALAATARGRGSAEGFTVLKVKVGTDAGRDVARVRAVRGAVGPDVRIRLDANQGWTPRDAVRVIRALEDAGLDVELVEQPVAARPTSTAWPGSPTGSTRRSWPTSRCSASATWSR